MAGRKREGGADVLSIMEIEMRVGPTDMWVQLFFYLLSYILFNLYNLLPVPFHRHVRQELSQISHVSATLAETAIQTTLGSYLHWF